STRPRMRLPGVQVMSTVRFWFRAIAIGPTCVTAWPGSSATTYQLSLWNGTSREYDPPRIGALAYGIGGPTVVRPRMTGALGALAGRLKAQRPTQPAWTGRPSRVTLPAIV